MSETNMRIVSTTEATDDVELLRAEAEELYGEDWSKHRFYGMTNALYSVIYEDDVPTVVSMLQQHPRWEAIDVWGICRKYYTRRPDPNLPTSDSIGMHGRLMFDDQYAYAQEQGYTKLVVTMARDAWVHVAKKRLPKYNELSVEPWYVSDNPVITMPGVSQYIMWTGSETCPFPEDK